MKSSRYSVGDVIRVMEAWAPPGLAYEWDRIGLTLGQPDAPVRTIMTALSVTAEAAQAAVKAKADLVVSHHPLIWDALKRIRTNDPAHAPLVTLLRAGIHSFAAHTNLDICQNGVNDVLAAAVGVKNTRPLFPVKHAPWLKLVTFVPESHLDAVREAVSRAGAGEIGAYTDCSFSTPGVGTFLPGKSTSPYSGEKGKVNEEPERRFETIVQRALLGRVLEAMFSVHPYEEPAYDLIKLENPDPGAGIGRVGHLDRILGAKSFAERVRKGLKVSHVRLIGDAKKKIGTVAVLGGAGGSQIADVPQGVDAYVTGDVKYHEAQLALDRGLVVIDAGHHGTERGIVPVMADRLRAALPGVKVAAYAEPDPFVAIT